VKPIRVTKKQIEAQVKILDNPIQLESNGNGTGKVIEFVQKCIDENNIQPGYCYRLPNGVSVVDFVKVYNCLMKGREAHEQ